ncbi:MAG: class I SAM-dependent methyltransferase [Bacteroidales bacterium]|jgi:SAM-dependent methyltransferase
MNSWDSDYKGNQPTPIYEPLWDMLQVFIQKLSIKTVLDFGCGDGAYSFLMGEKGLYVTGVDISLTAIKMAVANKNDCKDEKCWFIRHYSIPENLPNDSFDAVVMLNSYHCLTSIERQGILSQAKRVLKPEGFLFISALALEDESYPRQDWIEIESNTFEDAIGRKFHFFSFEELKV